MSWVWEKVDSPSPTIRKSEYDGAGLEREIRASLDLNFLGGGVSTNPTDLE